MLGILLFGLIGLALFFIWLKRRHRRKVDEKRAAVSGFPTAAEKRNSGARSATPDLWGPHQVGTAHDLEDSSNCHSICMQRRGGNILSKKMVPFRIAKANRPTVENEEGPEGIHTVDAKCQKSTAGQSRQDMPRPEATAKNEFEQQKSIPNIQIDGKAGARVTGGGIEIETSIRTELSRKVFRASRMMMKLRVKITKRCKYGSIARTLK